MPDSPAILSVQQSLVVINKPAGWVVHAAMQQEQHDLRAWCQAQPGLPAGLEPLHRLDRDTSGVVLYSADAAERALFGKMFEKGEIEKTYLALVFGKAHQKGVIKNPLHPDHPGPAQSALTRYRMQERFSRFSLLRVQPATGRKHQVRRHLSGIHHPVVGDERYASPRFMTVPGFPNRLWLHAFRLKLPDGRLFEAPLPPELVQHLAVLRAADEKLRQETPA